MGIGRKGGMWGMGGLMHGMFVLLRNIKRLRGSLEFIGNKLLLCFDIYFIVIIFTN